MKEQWKKVDNDAKLLINVEEGKTLPIRIELPISAFVSSNDSCCKRLLVVLRVLALAILLMLLGWIATIVVTFCSTYSQSGPEYEKSPFEDADEPGRIGVIYRIEEDPDFGDHQIYSAKRDERFTESNTVGVVSENPVYREPLIAERSPFVAWRTESLLVDEPSFVEIPRLDRQIPEEWRDVTQKMAKIKGLLKKLSKKRVSYVAKNENEPATKEPAVVKQVKEQQAVNKNKVSKKGIDVIEDTLAEIIRDIIPLSTGTVDGSDEKNNDNLDNKEEKNFKVTGDKIVDTFVQFINLMYEQKPKSEDNSGDDDDDDVDDDDLHKVSDPVSTNIRDSNEHQLEDVSLDEGAETTSAASSLQDTSNDGREKNHNDMREEEDEKKEDENKNANKDKDEKAKEKENEVSGERSLEVSLKTLEPFNFATLLTKYLEPVAGLNDELLIWYYLNKDQQPGFEKAVNNNEDDITEALRLPAARLLYSANIAEYPADVEAVLDVLLRNDKFARELKELLAGESEITKPEDVYTAQFRLVDRIATKLNMNKLTEEDPKVLEVFSRMIEANNRLELSQSGTVYRDSISLSSQLPDAVSDAIVMPSEKNSSAFAEAKSRRLLVLQAIKKVTNNDDDDDDDNDDDDGLRTRGDETINETEGDNTYSKNSVDYTRAVEESMAASDLVAAAVTTTTISHWEEENGLHVEESKKVSPQELSELEKSWLIVSPQIVRVSVGADVEKEAHGRASDGSEGGEEKRLENLMMNTNMNDYQQAYGDFYDY